MLRRSIASIAFAGLLSAAAAPLAEAAKKSGAMACCRGGAAMVCCVPSSGCEMKSCPGGDRDAILPDLAPAILEAATSGIEPALCTDRIVPLRVAVATLAVPPPDQPPRG